MANKKDSMDDNNNFISDYFYAAIELELTKDINDNDVDDYYNVFQTSWFIESLNDDGTFEPIKMQERLVQMQKPIKLEKQILVLKKEKQKFNIILYIYR